MWPAVVLFLASAWTELVFTGRTSPTQLALLIIAYSLLSWTAMTLVGRALWQRQGDPLGAAFGVLARFAPTEIRVTDPAICGRCPRPCRGRDGACFDCADGFDRAAPSRR